MLVELHQLEPHARVVDLARERFEIGQRAGSIPAGFGNVTANAQGLGSRATLERLVRSAFGLPEGLGALERPREAKQIAGVEEIVGGSPTPRRPYGAPGSASSSTSSSTGGMSSTVGIR